MSLDDRADRIRALVDTAPPLTEAQTAVLRSAMRRARPSRGVARAVTARAKSRSGRGREMPPELHTQGALNPRNGNDRSLPAPTDNRAGARRGQPIEAG